MGTRLRGRTDVTYRVRGIASFDYSPAKSSARACVIASPRISYFSRMSTSVSTRIYFVQRRGTFGGGRREDRERREVTTSLRNHSKLITELIPDSSIKRLCKFCVNISYRDGIDKACTCYNTFYIVPERLHHERFRAMRNHKLIICRYRGGARTMEHFSFQFRRCYLPRIYRVSSRSSGF